MLTYTQMKNKAVRLSRDTSAGTLTQLKEDMNTGYALFNAKLSRYFSRKQQFADIVDGQSIYQTPVDCVRIIGVTFSISNTYKTPLKEIRDEYQWREIVSYPYNSNWPAYFIMLGNDEFQVWPTPSQDVTNGIRFYYQVQDHTLSVEDITSTSTSSTVTVTNGSTLVTATSAVFTPQMKGLWFSLSGVTDTTWYEIVSVPTNSTLTLKSAFVGITGASQAFTVGQLPIIPGEYHDAPINYALYLFFSGKGNEVRAQQHLGLFNAAVNDAIQEYSSSTQGSVITEDDVFTNSWMLTPIAGA